MKNLFYLTFFFQMCLIPTIYPLTHIGSFQAETWTCDDGLPMNSIMEITQTPDGYLWLGTEAGVIRFDGSEFKTFSQENVSAFSNHIIVALMADQEGVLWIGTELGGIIQYQDGIFKRFSNKKSWTEMRILCLRESRDGSIWIGTRSGLFCYNKENIEKIRLPKTLATHEVSAFLEDRNGRMWVGTRGDGLVLLKKRSTGFFAEHIGLVGIDIRTLFEDRKGDIWIGTSGGGLFKFWENQLIPYSQKKGLSHPLVECLYEDRFGNIWIGTQGGGIDILPAGGKQGDHISGFPNHQRLNIQIIYCFYQDRDGILWVGTSGDGLISLRETRIITHTKKTGLSDDNVFGVFQDNQGGVWIGTKDSGVNYFKDNRYYNMTKRVGLPCSIVSMAESPGGYLWFGTLSNGVIRFKDNNIQTFTFPGGVDNNTFRSIFVDPAGNVFAGSASGKVYQFKHNDFFLIRDVHVKVNILYKDAEEKLWIGTFGDGLYSYNLKTGVFKNYNETSGLSNGVILCVNRDSSGILWICTLKGINCFSNGRFSSLLKKHGLPDSIAYWMLEDNSGDFWFSSNRGIYCINRNEMNSFFQGIIPRVNPTLYGKEAGMESHECNGGNQPGGWKTKDGKLWFPTAHGVSIIDPLNIDVNKKTPEVMIEKIIANRESYPLNKVIQLPPGKKDLEIYYTAISFIDHGKIQFRFKMQGYDEYWKEAGKNRIAYYTNLPPGDYIFHVNACNSVGVWNKTSTSIHFRLAPRFYQSRIFYIALFVLGGAPLIFFCYNCLMKSLRSEDMKNISKNSTDQQEAEKIIRKLVYLMEEEKVYKDPNMTLKSLSLGLAMSPRRLSQIIKTHFNTNFYEFLSRYRIQEAKEIINDPSKKSKTVIEIAYLVGYNSKSAFNRSFKKLTCMTPSQFRRVQND